MIDAPHPTSLDPTLAERLAAALAGRRSRDDLGDDHRDDYRDGPPVRRCASWVAAVDADGRAVIGHTVDSSSLGLGTCGTRVALARAIADGLGTPVAVALDDMPDDDLLCGLCRQTLLELAPAARITRMTDEGLVDVATNVAELLPDAFEEFRGDR